MIELHAMASHDTHHADSDLEEWRDANMMGRNEHVEHEQRLMPPSSFTQDSYGALDLSSARDVLEQRRERLGRESQQARELLQTFHRIKALYVSGKGLPPISKATLTGPA